MQVVVDDGRTWVRDGHVAGPLVDMLLNLPSRSFHILWQPGDLEDGLTVPARRDYVSVGVLKGRS